MLVNVLIACRVFGPSEVAGADNPDVAARKGGVGKTTLALHFSVLSDRPSRPTLIIDADPQGSAAVWYERRGTDRPLLAKASIGELPGIMADARASGAHTTIIDSAPHDLAGIVLAMRSADLVVIPTRAGILDLAAVAGTIEMARATQVPFLCLLNHTPAGRECDEASIVSEARAVLKRLGALVLRPYVAQRAVLAHSLVAGQGIVEFEPHGRAAAEIIAASQAIERTAALKEKDKADDEAA
jgi:chromosome partitioning protein